MTYGSGFRIVRGLGIMFRGVACHLGSGCKLRGFGLGTGVFRDKQVRCALSLF